MTGKKRLSTDSTGTTILKKKNLKKLLYIVLYIYNMENFSLDHIKTLSQNDAKVYLIKYFLPLTDGNHAFYINGKFQILDTKVIKST